LSRLPRDGEPRERLIFALDYADLDAARAGAACLRGEIGLLKVGLELYTRHGPAALTLADAADADLFLDLKLHDIPATVGRAVASVARLKRDGARVALLTVHASGGRAMLATAVEEAAGVEIVAVTVLTSLDDADLASVGVAAAPLEQALRLAELAWQAGVQSFVCSPAEASALRRALGPDAQLITPGVRPSGSGSQDQKRVTTPADAIRGGADRLVVGRPIRDAADPARAARAIVDEIAKTLAGPRGA
jgi:orotidine-5'-phosphate decarboxylase